MWAKQKRNVSSNYSCCSKKQFHVTTLGTHGALFVNYLRFQVFF